MKKFYVAGYWSEAAKWLLKEVENRDDYLLFPDDFKENKLWKVAFYSFRGWISFRNWRVEPLLASPLLDKQYDLYNCNFSEGDQHYVILFNSALTRYYSKGFFKRLKKKNRGKELKLILYIVDPMGNGLWRRLPEMLKCFDLIVTVHECNSKKYGFPYLPLVYSKIPLKNIYGNEEWTTGEKIDLYFCGGWKMRWEILNRVRLECRKRGLKTVFVVPGLPENYKDIYDEGMQYDMISYEQNLKMIDRSNCIFEAMREGYVGITQRYLEAICYNKKLLTNNQSVIHEKYYDPRFIQVFDRIEDIDFNWIEKDEKVDYGYEGDYEPSKCFGKIPEMLIDK